jgi:hypothetical protein
LQLAKARKAPFRPQSRWFMTCPTYPTIGDCRAGV